MDLSVADQRIPTLSELLRLSREALSNLGLACISLVCSTGLPGAEDVEIPVYLARVAEWADIVRQEIPKFVYAFESNPTAFANSESVFLMRVLVQVLKLKMGIHCNEKRTEPSESNAWYTDSRDLLIHGPLGPTRRGTCNNIPMAVAAVARELGYPVYLATTPYHVYGKWVGSDGYTFNIEATNPAGMVSHSDDYYRDRPVPMPDSILRSGYYMRPLDIVDELALCMVSRGWVLEAHHQYPQAALAHAHACRLAPTEPNYPRVAARCVSRWMRCAYNANVSEQFRISCKGEYQYSDLYLDPQRLLPAEHVPLALTIMGRFYETHDKRDLAAAIYDAAGSLYRDKRNRLNSNKARKLRLTDESVTESNDKRPCENDIRKESLSC